MKNEFWNNYEQLSRQLEESQNTLVDKAESLQSELNKALLLISKLNSENKIQADLIKTQASQISKLNSENQNQQELIKKLNKENQLFRGLVATYKAI